MDIVEGVVDEERTVAVPLDELRRFRGESVGQVLAFGAVLETRIAIGGEVFLPAIGAASVDAAPVHVESLVLRPPAFGTEVPLAGEEGGVSRLLQDLGEGDLFTREPVGIGRREQLRVAFPMVRRQRCSDEVGDAVRCGHLPVTRAARVGEQTGQAA